jgi:DNA repair protein RadC
MKISEIKISYKSLHQPKIRVGCSRDLYKLSIKQWDSDLIEAQEEVKLVLLNRGNYVIGIHDLSKGGICSSIIDVRLVMSISLKCLASSIALVHNHPSGNLKPSNADLNITEKVNKASKYFDIKLIDHMIITKKSYFSFADENLL